MSKPNSHIRRCGGLFLINGNPGAYLDGLRDTKNKVPTEGPDRIERRREKFDFVDLVTRLGARAPKTFALISGGSVREGAFARGEPVGTLLGTLPQGTYFCKPNIGRNGIGAFRLTLSSNGPTIDDEPSSAAAVTERLSSEDYLIQEWMAPLQHPDIARFKAGVINTMRLITFDTENGPKAVAASLRVAISLKSIDSWTQGGVVAAIDLERGVLKPFGSLKKTMKIVDAHPGSGLAFRGQPVPHFREAVATACRLHSRFDKPKSIGWDIGLLNDGPCFFEANAPWDILMSAQFNPELVPEFMAFHLPHACELAARVDLRGSFDDRTTTCRGLARAVGSAMGSGRIERFSQERVLLTIGGTKLTTQVAVRNIKVMAEKLGVTHMGFTQTEDKPERGFDVTAAFAKP